jgi:hypothetical protein
VHDVQIEVVDVPVCELLAADGLDLLAVVEAVPELGDDEEILTLNETILNGAGDTLTALDLIAVVFWEIRSVLCALQCRRIECLPQAPSNRR